MEEDIAENEMHDIIKYINGLSFKKKKKAMEIKEALQLIKSKMIKEEEEKLQKMKEEYQQEINQNFFLRNTAFINNNNEQNSKEETNKEEKQDIKNQQSKEDIEVLESNWNNSVRKSSNALIDKITRRR